MILRRGLLALVMLGGAGVAAADVASDQAAAIVVYPVVFTSAAAGVDTLVQLSNTSNTAVSARCFYVNANGHCSNDGSVCFSGAECGGGLCLPGWSETDFRVTLTPRQPLAWLASEGLSTFCTPAQTPGERCLPLDGRSRGGAGQSNAGSRVPPVGEPTFVGELRCVAVDDQDRPSERNVLVGATTMVQALAGSYDLVRHNAIGIPAIAGANDGDDMLRLGEEYAACPHTLILDHFFDDAVDPATGAAALGVVALVPCSVDFELQDPSAVIAQFLVFNEFEQRFSSSTLVDCFALRRLSNLDTTQPVRSIFNVGVAGSLIGQTRIRGVGAGGHGLLGAFFDAHGNQSAAANIHFQGISDPGDVIRLP
ncbi:MAG: hypothetical protein HY699_21285 [Deltaproteobacteria bacterium]|nr:hypothetical protein [Deltaproteobacteria bacterium]